MDETRTIGWSLVVLLASLLLVYVIFFDIHGPEIVASTTTAEQSAAPIIYKEDKAWDGQISNNSKSDDVYAGTQVTSGSDTLIQSQNTDKRPLIVEQESQTVNDSSKVTTTTTVSTNPNIIKDAQGRAFYSTDFLFGRTTQIPSINVGTSANPVNLTTNLSNTSASVLPVNQAATTVTTVSGKASTEVIPNTRRWDGKMELLDMLNLEDNYSYILKNVNNTHFVFLGTFEQNIAGIVGFLGGSAVDITNQVVIQNNLLFGERVTKIELPTYKSNLKEIFLVQFFGGDSWLIQIDKDWYQKRENKEKLKGWFDAIY